MEQSKDIKQDWTGAENFDNCLCLIFDCYYKYFILLVEVRLGTTLYHHPILSFTYFFLIF